MPKELEFTKKNIERGFFLESESSTADKESRFESLSTLVSYLIKSGEDAARILDAAQELTIKDASPEASGRLTKMNDLVGCWDNTKCSESLGDAVAIVHQIVQDDWSDPDVIDGPEYWQLRVLLEGLALAVQRRIAESKALPQ